MRSRRSSTKPPLLPLESDRLFVLLVVLLAAVFLMGGGSRHDIDSLPYLRAFACVTAAVGLLGLGRTHLRAYRVPFVLLFGLALLMVVQLVPLPPSLWTRLPTRETIEQLDAALGLAGTWRPISISPMKTANSLASLSVPFAVLVLYCQLSAERQRQVLVVLAVLALTGAVLGILQLLAGSRSGLYPYAISHKDAAIGFFANRNHHTAFLAAAMLVCLHLAMERGTLDRRVVPMVFFAGAVVLFMAVVGNISRGGLLSAGVALVLAPMAIPGRIAATPDPGNGGSRAPARRGRRWTLAALFAVPALAVFALFALSQRSPALARLLAVDQIEDMRERILPVVLEMTRTYQPWGAGFGAFEYAYRINEPAALLVRNYFNNAHNDWLQLVIEGGVGGLALAAFVAVAGVVRVVALVRAGRRQPDPRVARAWLGLAMLAVFGFASLFDYPLRVPAIMAVAIVALAMLFGPVLEHRPRAGCEGDASR